MKTSLHAAVVELVALDDATIKYSTVQNWYPATKRGAAASTTSSPSAGDCRGPVADFLDAGGSRLGHHLEVSERASWRRRVGGRILFRGLHEPEDAGRHRHEDDPHRPQHPQHDRVQGHFRRRIREHLPRAGEDVSRCASTRATIRSAIRCSSATAAPPTRSRVVESENPHGGDRARGHHLAHQRGPVVLPAKPRHRRRRMPAR
jgi:Fe-S cluster assembly scaffold protein SufB